MYLSQDLRDMKGLVKSKYLLDSLKASFKFGAILTHSTHIAI